MNLIGKLLIAVLFVLCLIAWSLIMANLPFERALRRKLLEEDRAEGEER